MPKVGLQTIEATLRASGLPQQIFRLHFLSPLWRRALRRGLNRRVASNEWHEDIRGQLTLMRHVLRRIRMHKWLRRCGMKVPKLEIVTGIRDIVGLALSSV